jgi:hypothetical protein
VAADDQLVPLRNWRRRRRDDEPGADTSAETASGCRSHGRRGLPRGDQPEVVRRRAVERRIDESPRRSGSETGPDNRQEIVSKIRE